MNREIFYREDEAVSPVVAFMLILTILVSFIALLHTVYIPGLKQQAEIEHIRSVEYSFGSISTDIERMVTFGENGEVKQRILLGGGDVLFSPLRSSGTIRVNESNPNWVCELVVGNVTDTSSVRVMMVNLSYEPVGNFWMNQGYEWNEGIINVTKGRGRGGHSRTTWYEQNTPAEAEREIVNFLTGLVRIDEVYHEKQNVSRLDLTAVTFSPESQRRFESGNGMASFRLVSEGESVIIGNCTEIILRVNDDLPEREAVLDTYFDIFDNSLSRYSTYLVTRNTDNIQVTKAVQADPAEVRISSRTIQIGVE